MQDSKSKIFEEELFPHMEALKTFAYHLTYQEDDAEDLVQETYLKAHKFLDHYVSGTNAKAWLFKILKNAYINSYRKKVKMPSRVDMEDVMAFKENEVVRSPGSEDLVSEQENTLGDEVTLAMNSLSDEFREIIILSDIEDFSYEEIAEITGLPLGTVRSRLFRARNELKEKLRTYAENLGFEDKRGKPVLK